MSSDRRSVFGSDGRSVSCSSSDDRRVSVSSDVSSRNASTSDGKNLDHPHLNSGNVNVCGSTSSRGDNPNEDVCNAADMRMCTCAYSGACTCDTNLSTSAFQCTHRPTSGASGVSNGGDDGGGVSNNSNSSSPSRDGVGRGADANGDSSCGRCGGDEAAGRGRSASRQNGGQAPAERSPATGKI
jgi:hypothetical protein